MKSSSMHAILGEIHRLLGDFDADDFLKASRYSGTTPSVQEALRALAQEAKHDLKTVQSSSKNKLEHRSEKAEISRRNEQSSGPDIFGAIQRLGSVAALGQFSNAVGLEVSPRPKESRERLAKRVAAALALLPEQRRSQVLGQLVGNGDSQTQGWINAIKNPRK